MIAPLLPTYNRAPVSFVSGQGSWLEAADGRRFLDLGAGIAVNALGHAHPALVEVLTQQATKLWHVSNVYRIAGQERLAEALVEATFADTVFFTNSGTESAELGIKMVRKYWSTMGQPERVHALSFEGAFHGRSTGAIAAAGAEKLTDGFGPLMPGFETLPFGDLAALEAAITPQTAAVFIEPVQGEGGIRELPDTFLRRLRELCDETGALLVFDEVQCGMGRTGKLFAHEWAGVTPDIMLVAKGIGGGFPLGAVLATEAVGQAMRAGSHGSTYGGNPLAMAVGAKVLEIVGDPAFLDDVRRKSGLMRQGLAALVDAHPGIFEEVRGVGLMLGLKCVVPNTDVVAAGMDAGVLTIGAADNVVRLLPALNIDDADIREGLARLEQAATALAPAEQATA